MAGIVGRLMETILYVADMPGQVMFYRDRLGLGIKYPAGPADYSTEYWVEFETGGCTLVLHGGGQKRLGPDAPKVVFSVADIHAARAALVERGVTLSVVRSPAPGVLVADGQDPEGNQFSIESKER